MVDRARAYDAERCRHPRDAALAALATRQHGVVSRTQLRELGFTKDAIRRRVERDRLVPVHAGVFAVGHTALTADSRRMGAVLACGPGSLLSYRAAGSLQALLSSSPQLDVTVPRAIRARGGIVVHRSRLIHREDRDLVRGIPVTSVARTLVDLADVLSEERLAKAVHEAEIRRVFDLNEVDRVLDRVTGRGGRGKLLRALAAYKPTLGFTRSAAERRFLALCERHGLPRPETNTWIGGYEVDAYWPDAELAVEVDGGETHLTRQAFEADRARDRRLAARGIQVLRVTWRHLNDEAALAAELHVVRQGRRCARSR